MIGSIANGTDKQLLSRVRASSAGSRPMRHLGYREPVGHRLRLALARIPISSPIGLVPALDVRRQAVPKAAQAGRQLPAMADRPDRKAGCIDEGMDDAS
jgi:hypothetical protein